MTPFCLLQALEMPGRHRGEGRRAWCEAVRRARAARKHGPRCAVPRHAALSLLRCARTDARTHAPLAFQADIGARDGAPGPANTHAQTRSICYSCLLTEVNYSLLPDPNLFRRSCYVGEVSAELSAHAVSLRELHAALSEYEFGAYAKRMGSKGWLEALRALDFLGGNGGSDGDLLSDDDLLLF